MLHLAVHLNSLPYRSSYIFGPLNELAAQGKIALEWRVPWHRDGYKMPIQDRTLVEVSDPEADWKRRVIFDFHDEGFRLNERLLKEADLYFKRSYSRRDVARVAPELQAKIKPLGLPFACRNDRDTNGLRRALGYYKTHYGKADGQKHSPAAVRRVLEDYHRWRTLAPIHNFEQTPDTSLEPTILFQTRLWGPGTTSTEDREALNRMRVELIRALRKTFGERFVGGLIPDAYAREIAPDCLADAPTDRSAYIRYSRPHPIGICSIGLHQSNPWKLSEYLAGAKCILTEPLFYETPVPLQDGKNYFVFPDAAACVERCRYLLDNPEAVTTMRQANADYYHHHVRPSSWLESCLVVIRNHAEGQPLRPTDALLQEQT